MFIGLSFERTIKKKEETDMESRKVGGRKRREKS